MTKGKLENKIEHKSNKKFYNTCQPDLNFYNPNRPELNFYNPNRPELNFYNPNSNFS